MSDTKHGRFEIDLEEIERQLRRSAEAPSAPKSDPLAELARIVGQDDPFKSLFANPTGGAGESPAGAVPGRAAASDSEARLAQREQDAILHGPADDGAGRPGDDDLFDPVSEAYGSLDNAIDEDRFQPLTPRRSRKRLAGAVVAVVLAVAGTAGALAWRSGGTRFAATSDAPPIIKADNAPLKVAPENPGGMEIPNQDRQIYERGTPDAQTRVVDRQEQPIDVREAARALPPAPEPAAAPPAVTGAVPSPAGSANPDAVPRASRPNPVTSALGEPRRVRTVSVRPDGTLTSAPPTAMAALPSPIPSGGLPPPVQVATIPITVGSTSTSSASTPAAPAAASAPEMPMATAAPPAAPSGGATPAVAPNGVSVLPPRRPKLDTKTATPAAASRVAALASPDGAAQDQAEAAPAAPATEGRGYVVQLAVRPTEQEARATSSQLATKYAPDLAGRTAAVARAEVKGKTVYRVRVGPLPREDANTLCTRLKASGGQCFVSQI